MKDLKFNNGDLVIEENDAVLIDDADELQQVVEELLRVFRGEWYFNAQHGTDYFSFMGKQFDEDIATSAILDALSQEPRIETIEDVTFDYKDNRALEIHMLINGRQVTVDAVD